MDANLTTGMASYLDPVLKENKGRHNSNSELTGDALRILLRVDRDPLLNLVCKLLLHILEGGFDDLAGSTGGRPEMENNDTTHSIFSTVT